MEARDLGGYVLVIGSGGSKLVGQRGTRKPGFQEGGTGGWSAKVLP